MSFPAISKNIPNIHSQINFLPLVSICNVLTIHGDKRARTLIEVLDFSFAKIIHSVRLVLRL